MRQEQPEAEPRTYIVRISGREYRRTRQHIRPRRSQSQISDDIELLPISAPVTNHDDNQRSQDNQRVDDGQQTQNPTTQNTHEPISQTAQCSESQNQSAKDNTKVHTTRYGRTTRVPAKYTN